MLEEVDDGRKEQAAGLLVTSGSAGSHEHACTHRSWLQLLVLLLLHPCEHAKRCIRMEMRCASTARETRCGQEAPIPRSENAGSNLQYAHQHLVEQVA